MRQNLKNNLSVRRKTSVLTHTKLRQHITPTPKHLHWFLVKYRFTYKPLLLTSKVLHALDSTVPCWNLLHEHDPSRNLRSLNSGLLSIRAPAGEPLGTRPSRWQPPPSGTPNGDFLCSQSTPGFLAATLFVLYLFVCLFPREKARSKYKLSSLFILLSQRSDVGNEPLLYTNTPCSNVASCPPSEGTCDQHVARRGHGSLCQRGEEAGRSAAAQTNSS